jgi:hypothetical protein
MAMPNRDLYLEHNFPQLMPDGYSPESDANGDYNCFAWAASIDHTKWAPHKRLPLGWDWPNEAPREMTLSAFIRAYETLGYKQSDLDFSLEPKYEKIVIYVDVLNEPQHAARQLADGLWTSKMGHTGRDIHHNSPAGVVDPPRARHSRYGKVAVCMKRRRRREHVCLRVPGVKDNIPQGAFMTGCLWGWLPWFGDIPDAYTRQSQPVS